MFDVKEGEALLQIEEKTRIIRQNYQTEDVKWIGQKKNWKGLKSIVMETKRSNTDILSAA